MEKKPAPLAWQLKIRLSAEEIKQMTVQFPHATNTGACCERTPALDVDISDPFAAEAVRSAIIGDRGDMIFRTGRPPKFLTPFRTDAPFPKLLREFRSPNDAIERLEFLGQGQQFIAAGIHPDLHRAYEWLNGNSLETTPRASLPEITESEATELLDHLAELLAEQFDFVPLQKGQGRDPDASEFIVQVKDTVDVEAELAAIRFGNIHDTWKRCMGALLRGGTPANDVIRQLKAATEQSPACQADPKRRLWTKALAELATWYIHTDPIFVASLDALIKVVRDDQNLIIVEIEDMRDGPEGTQLLSKLVVVSVGQDNAGRPLTSAVVESVDPSTRSDGHKLPKLTANQKTMFSILDAAPGGLTTDEWNDQAKDAGIGVKRRADLHDLRNSLKARGLVCLNGDRWFVASKFKSRLD